jgi:hypothetical protein
MQHLEHTFQAVTNNSLRGKTLKELSLLFSMKEVILKDHFAFLYCNRELYSQSALKKTIQDYSDFVKVQLEKMGKYYILKLETESQDYTLEDLSYEFLNYALAQSFEER